MPRRNAALARWIRSLKRFDDPADEGRFQLSRAREMVGPVRVTSLVGAAAMVALAVVDLLTLGDPGWNLFVRLGILLPTLLLTGLLTFHRRRDVLLVPATASAFAVVGIVVSANLRWLPIDRATVVQGGVLLVLIAGYTCTRLPPVPAAVAGGLVTGVNGLFVLSLDLPLWQRCTFLLYVAVANVLGVMIGTSQEATARRHHLDRRRLANQRVRLVRANRELRVASLRDPLTGLLNRRALEIRLGEAVGQAERGGPAGTLVLLDLDGFKQVNDGLGHAAGDELLRQIARALEEGLRQGDSIYRLGGDEFCLFLPTQSAAEAAQCASRLLALLLQVTRPLEVAVGFSAGCSRVLPTDISGDDVLARADHHLYRAKKRGGGAVTWDRDELADGIRERRQALRLVM